MKDVQCYELFGGIALKNHILGGPFAAWHFPQRAFYVTVIVGYGVGIDCLHVLSTET